MTPPFILLTLALMVTGIQAVNKCCPNDQELVGYGKCAPIEPNSTNGTYWWFPEETLFSNEKNFPDKSLEGPRIGHVPCLPHQWRMITIDEEFSIRDNGDFVYFDPRSNTSNWIFKEDAYCVDRFLFKSGYNSLYTYVFHLCASKNVPTRMVCCEPGHYVAPTGECAQIPEEAPFKKPIEIDMDYFTYVKGPGCRDHDRSFLIDLNVSHHSFLPQHLEIYSIKYKSHSYCLSQEPFTGHMLAYFCASVSEKFNFYPYFIFTGVFFFSLTLIFHALLPELRSTNHAKYLIGHIISLLIGFICIGIGQLRAEKTGSLCFIQAFVIQYSFLAAFFWLNVMCLDISWTFRYKNFHRWLHRVNFINHQEDHLEKYRKFSNPDSGFRPNAVGSIIERNRRKFIRYSIYAWGVPAIISIITAFMQFLPANKDNLFHPGFGLTGCWFPNKSPAIWLYFYGPTTLLMFINIALFIFTACRIIVMRRDTQSVLQNQQSEKHHKPTRRDKQTFSLYSKLFFLMGISWATEMLSSIIGGPRYYYYFTDILNLLRAVFIFIIFCCKRKVMVLLADHYGEKIPILKRLFPNDRKMSSSKSTGVTNSSFVQQPRKNEADIELT